MTGVQTCALPIYELTALVRKDIPTEPDMPIERIGFVLCQNADTFEVRIQAVRKGKINNAINAAKRHRWLGTMFRQGIQTFPLPSRKYHGQGVLNNRARASPNLHEPFANRSNKSALSYRNMKRGVKQSLRSNTRVHKQFWTILSGVRVRTVRVEFLRWFWRIPPNSLSQIIERVIREKIPIRCTRRAKFYRKHTTPLLLRKWPIRLHKTVLSDGLPRSTAVWHKT